MGLFGRKKPEERPKTDIQEIKKAVVEEFNPETFSVQIPPKKPEEPPKIFEPQKKEEKKPRFAPLFVKIDRYDSVLNLLNDLKATVMMVKNVIVVQKEIEKLAEENRRLIEDSVNKIDDKLLRLDSEFMRPKGFKEQFKTSAGTKPGLESVVDELKSQVEDLKSELENIS